MKPLIGVTLHEENDTYTLNTAYAKLIAKAGGIPLLLPHGTNITSEDILCCISGIVLSGGGDIDPIYFGEEPQAGLGSIYPERDIWEVELCQRFLACNKAVFGICRGIQILNVAAGGSLWQCLTGDVLKHMQDAPKSYATHTVKVLPATFMNKITGAAKMRVNSFHKQAVKAVAPGFKATCFTEDGVIEAIESEENKFAIGVQWHPEHLWDYEETRRLFRAFMAEASHN